MYIRMLSPKCPLFGGSTAVCTCTLCPAQTCTFITDRSSHIDHSESVL